MAAGQQNVGAADEGRADNAVSHHVDLPNRGVAEQIALDDHVTDDDYGEADQQSTDHAERPRHKRHGSYETIHNDCLAGYGCCGSGLNRPAVDDCYFTASASSISFWPFGTSLAY